MKILLDTHLLIWIHTNTSKLPKAFFAYAQDSENQFYYSSASIWETQIKYTKNKALFPISGSMLDKYCLQSGMNCLLIKPEHSFLLDTLAYSDKAQREHKDPFDRLLICQAKSEDMLFLTHDELLPYYNEPCVKFI